MYVTNFYKSMDNFMRHYFYLLVCSDLSSYIQMIECKRCGNQVPCNGSCYLLCIIILSVGNNYHLVLKMCQSFKRRCITEVFFYCNTERRWTKPDHREILYARVLDDILQGKSWQVLYKVVPSLWQCLWEAVYYVLLLQFRFWHCSVIFWALGQKRIVIRKNRSVLR